MGPGCQLTPLVSNSEIGEAAFDGAAVVWLTDGEDSSDTKATYMIYVMRWFDWCYQLELRPNGGGSSPVMAARQSSARGVLTTVRPCCLIRARYELHEVTKELSKPREEDEEVSMVGGRGELRSGETPTWRTAAEVANRPSPKLD